MLIKDIFELPIERNINPAVVVSATDKETIEAEIKEYVFTDDLLERSWKFLDSLVNKKNLKAGIWINGYYGSGKSHFLKFMHYCLNSSVSAWAFDKIIKAAKGYDPMLPGHNEQITEAKVKLLHKKISEINCSNIMFNVEAVTDDHSGEKLTRIFLNQFNANRGYNSLNIPLALLLEKPLDRAGKLAEFKSRIAKDLQHDWNAEAADLAAYKLEGILEIAKGLLPYLDVKALHNTLTNPDTYHIGITSKLIPELKEYIAEQGENYRLIFLVDEISQYIGNNKDVLLNLQTIVEEVSTQLKNKVWIALTAQQTLDEVVDRFEDSGRSEEFGKILGRFDTRISMESTDASFITKKRVLDKNSGGISELHNLYTDKHEFIQHQFKLSHDLYKGYNSEDDFILSYPFVPYQFRLIADVFSAFQRMNYVITEVKNNERSVIGITHYTAKQYAKENVGLFVAFDYFFNDLFKNNLTHIGGRIVNKALSLTYVTTNAFAERVVKVLFLISNLEDSVLMTFPPNLDNLTVLLMTELDQNKAELQRKINEVLDRLIEESIIREESKKYFFYSEDEIQVANLIKNNKVPSDDRLSIVNDLINPLLKVESKVSLESNDIKIGFAIDGKDFLRGGDIKANIVLYDKQRAEDRAVNTISNDLYICLNEGFYLDEPFTKDLDNYIKTVHYFRNNSSAATGEREKTLQLIKHRNDAVKDKLMLKFVDLISQSRMISQQQIIDAASIPGATTKDRFGNTVRFHLERVFRYMKFAANYCRTAAELRMKVQNSIQVDILEVPPGEAKLEEYLSNNGNEATIEDLIKEFGKIPFGWRDISVIDMVVMLNARKLRDLEYKTKPRYAPKDFVEKAIITSERSSCMVKPIGDLDVALVAGAKKAFSHIFNLPDGLFSTDGHVVADEMHNKIKDYLKDYSVLRDKYQNNYPFGVTFQKMSEALSGWSELRDVPKLFREITDAQTTAKELRDKAEKLKVFIGATLPKYDEIRLFILGNERSIKHLGKPDQDKAAVVTQFFMNPEPAAEFRVVNKQYEELKAALQSTLQRFQTVAVEKYTNIFHELKELIKREKEEYAGLNEEATLNRLRQMTDITLLELEISKADDFKANHIESILNKGNKANDDGNGTTERLKVNRIKSTISSKSELEDFIGKLQRQMEAILDQKKTIIIE